MGSMFTRLRQWSGADHNLTEEGKPDIQQTERAANRPEDNSDGHKVFLHNPDDPETGVFFGVNIEEKDGRFVFKDVREDGLAYKTGFRSSDVLVMAYSIDIDNVDVKQLLKGLLDYKEFNYFIGVARKLEDGKKTFIWKIFKITTKGGVPDVVVLETLKNDKNVIPDANFTADTPTYDYLLDSSKPYNIYIERDGAPSEYLQIKNKQLLFNDFNESSKFFQYNYLELSDGKKGTVQAYSLYSSFNEGEISSPATFQQNKKKTTALDFPEYMTGDGIPPDARFWYKRVYHGGFSLGSMIAPGMYLGRGSDHKAILSTTKTELQISRDEAFDCESNVVE